MLSSDTERGAGGPVIISEIGNYSLQYD